MCSNFTKVTRLYTWLDVSGTAQNLIPIRFRVLSVNAPVVPILGTMFLIYPAIAFIRGPWRRDSRLINGLCRGCGYNLTGNVSGVCPECGLECTDDDTRKAVAKRRRKYGGGFIVGLVMLWGCWDTVQEIRKARPLHYFTQHPSHLLLVFSIASLVGVVVKLVSYLRGR